MMFFCIQLVSAIPRRKISHFNYFLIIRFIKSEQSPLRSPDKSSITLEKSMSQLIKEDSKSSPAVMKYTKSKSILKGGSQGKATTLEDILENNQNQKTSSSLSFYDLANKNRTAYLKKEIASDDEDSDDFSDMDDSKKGIKSFLESHSIQIFIKNPGKMF